MYSIIHYKMKNKLITCLVAVAKYLAKESTYFGSQFEKTVHHGGCDNLKSGTREKDSMRQSSHGRFFIRRKVMGKGRGEGETDLWGQEQQRRKERSWRWETGRGRDRERGRWELGRALEKGT